MTKPPHAKVTLTLMLLASATVLGGLGLSRSAPEPAAGAGETDVLHSVKALDGFVGEWTIDAKWDSGQPLKARAIYSRELGGKHLRTQTFVKKDDGSEYQRYEGVMTWHPRRKSLVIYSFAYDGSVQENLAQTDDGKTFRVGFTPYDPGAPNPVRQTLTLVSPDAFDWTVEMRVGDSDQWQRLIKAQWKRTGP